MSRRKKTGPECPRCLHAGGLLAATLEALQESIGAAMNWELYAMALASGIEDGDDAASAVLTALELQ